MDHEGKTKDTIVTAVQDWLRIGPLTPQNVVTFACGLLRTGGSTTEAAYPTRGRDHVLMGPGLERC